MKYNKTRTCVAAALALLAFTMITCVDQTIPYEPSAELLALTIGDVTIDAIPEYISPEDWNNETFTIAGADYARASFIDKDYTTEQRIRATVNSGSRADWGIGTRGTRPNSFSDIRVPVTFNDQDYIYIRVTADDNETMKYYRVYTRFRSFVTDLNNISIDGRVGKAVDPAGEKTWNAPELDKQISDISITVRESKDAMIETVTYDPNATVKFAAVRGSETPEFIEPPLNLNDQDTLYVEVTAENTKQKRYFKYLVNVGRMATINTLKFVGNKEKEIYGKGLPDEDWLKVSAGTFSTASGDQPDSGFSILIEPDDDQATFEYALFTGDPKVDHPSLVGKPDKVKFATTNSLAIKVMAPSAGIVRYYRIAVTLTAGNIMKQPKSTWYYKGDKVEPLFVELDPPDTGQYSYQWYEADSWYGIYGRHGYGIDEKGNISCVNGGPGQYFYVVQPDVIALGGTQQQPAEPFAWSVTNDSPSNKTYTPPNNWVNMTVPPTPINTVPKYPGTQLDTLPAPPYNPHQAGCYFLQGGTSETRYYWVKVTNKDTGLTVVSDRAVILTELDKRMKHFVFDLSLLPVRKNLVPFVKKGEVFKIDLTDYPFPDDFDPSMYEICIAHAQYFLPDGRAWTQNWTHGDLHFGYTEGSSSYKQNGGALTWWHNNMGANSGSIPLQAPHSAKGGLLYKPDWIGFAPSGDPEKGIPKPDPATGELPKGIYSMSADDPYPAGVAQGYFAGFIELLEIHFSTPPPK